ncbi:hypothetical protein [Hymenobacter terrestris]|uniref:Uncharacterized protein n=1 Tax=Hymenobacter terrestris TaxID=2748310 RepID=A0ABX2Q999_9BACT|nr:hypothetical protein [Hymenobacter terrestris]NVO86551.1 hypothetical protein [Hymenobacter terrestris]
MLKKLPLIAGFVLMASYSQGQSYNNISNYPLLNGVIGRSRAVAHANLAKAGYKLMTYQEVCVKEQEAYSKDFFDMTAHYRYLPKAGSTKAPYYVTVVFNPEAGPNAAAIEWNEYMTPGRGDVMDNVLKTQGLHLYDTIEGSVSGPSATAMYFRNAQRYLIFNGRDGTRLVKFTLAVKSD